jgi:murein DD-endopeptidase MepM/ murein hydrolase activator NlpD
MRLNMNLHKHRKIRKKGADNFTLIIVPASIAKPIKINFSKKVITSSLLIIALLAFSALATTYRYYSSLADFKRVDEIKQENHDKDATIEKLANEIKAIDKKQQELQDKQTQLKKMMGIKVESRHEEEPSRGGKGGTDLQERPAATADSFDSAELIRHNLADEEEEINQLIARIKDDIAYFRALPNQWPAEGEISSPFGWRDSPFGGRSEGFHDGLDLANNVGTPILAAGDGTVISAGWKPVYGRTIEINHGNGLVTKYSHNSQLLVSEGDKVKKGQKIALMGTTGRSTGPHLHFTLFKQNIVQDPMIYLPEE